MSGTYRQQALSRSAVSLQTLSSFLVQHYTELFYVYRRAVTFFLSSIRKFSLWPKLVPDSSYRSLFHLYIIFFTTLFTRWMHRRLHRIHWQIWGKDVPGGLKRQVHLFNTTSTICKFLSLSLKDCTWLTRSFTYFRALRYTVHSIPKFFMFDGWEFSVLLFGGYLGFSPSLQFKSVRGSAWRGLDNGAVFEFGHDLLLSNSSIVSFRLFRYQCVDLLFDPDCILG